MVYALCPLALKKLDDTSSRSGLNIYSLEEDEIRRVDSSDLEFHLLCKCGETRARVLVSDLWLRQNMSRVYLFPLPSLFFYLIPQLKSHSSTSPLFSAGDQGLWCWNQAALNPLHSSLFVGKNVMTWTSWKHAYLWFQDHHHFAALLHIVISKYVRMQYRDMITRSNKDLHLNSCLNRIRIFDFSAVQ